VPVGLPCASYSNVCAQCVDTTVHPASPNCRYCGTTCQDGGSCTNAVNVAPGGACPTPAPTPAPTTTTTTTGAGTPPPPTPLVTLATLAPEPPTPSPTPLAGSPCGDYDQCGECVQLTNSTCDWCALGSSAFGQCRLRDACSAPFGSAVRAAAQCPATSIGVDIPLPSGMQCPSTLACERFCKPHAVLACDCSDRFVVQCADSPLKSPVVQPDGDFSGTDTLPAVFVVEPSNAARISVAGAAVAVAVNCFKL
jgi:hypothetical protein